MQNAYRWMCIGAAAFILVNSVSRAAPPEEAGPWPKLILWGSIGSPTSMLKDKDRLAKMPFDGIVLTGEDNTHRGGGSQRYLYSNVFAAGKRIKKEDFSGFIRDTKAMMAVRPDMTENFLQVSAGHSYAGDQYVEAPGQEGLQLWFGKEGKGKLWARTLDNTRVAAEITKEAGLRGWVVDFETYDLGLWLFSIQADAKQLGKNLDETWAQIRKRGREFVGVLNDVYPDMTIIIPVSYWYCTDRSYQLIPAFLDGMYEAADAKMRLVDGWEPAYRYTERQQFLDAYWQMHCDLKRYSAVPDVYARRVSAGFGIWLDGFGWSIDNPTAKYPPDKWADTVTQAMRIADHYVWVYTEDRVDTPNWWTARNLPDIYLDVTAKAKQEARRLRTDKPWWRGDE